jgi:sulfur transfer complex TusBCD TusB component (DsrH family)
MLLTEDMVVLDQDGVGAAIQHTQAKRSNQREGQE